MSLNGALQRIANRGRHFLYSPAWVPPLSTGPGFSIELTPNEFEAFSAHASDYRLAVVVAVLVEPTLSICRYSDELGRWMVEG